MLEIAPAEAAVITCHDDAPILDAFPRAARAFSCRVAHDELLLLGAKADASALLSHASSSQRAAGSRGIAMDISDAWSVWTVRGQGIVHMFARLSSNPLPVERPTLVQGIFAQVPAKVLFTADAAHIMVPSSVGHHLRRRILEACVDLSPRVVGPEALVIDTHDPRSA